MGKLYGAPARIDTQLILPRRQSAELEFSGGICSRCCLTIRAPEVDRRTRYRHAGRVLQSSLKDSGAFLRLTPCCKEE